MIPRTLFYCWFGGGEMSELEKRCLESWNEHCQGWDIVRVDETVFDPNSHPYSKEAYEHGSWAFVSDIARMVYLRKYGGFYLDTDMELFKPLDTMTRHRAVVGVMARGFWASGILACEAGFWPDIFHEAFDNIKLGEALHENLNKAIYRRYDVSGDPYVEYDGIGLYDVEYIANKRQPITEQTIALHHENNSWVGSWTGGFKDMADFVPFEVEGVDMSSWYGGAEPLGRLVLDDGVEPTLDIVELGNYFRNPRVVKLVGNGFVFTRKGRCDGTAKDIGCGTIYLD